MKSGSTVVVVMAALLVSLLVSGCSSISGSTTASLGGTYIPTDEAGPMTIGLDDHDYDLVVQSVSGEMFKRGLPKGYVVALGPVSTRETPYDVRALQIQESLQAVFNKEGTLKWQMLVDATMGASTSEEMMKIKDFNWGIDDKSDAEMAMKLGKVAKVSGILVGRVSSLETKIPGGGRQIIYRFVWKLINTETGLLDISYEYKLGKKLAK
ncbi:MAG: hypothetical protein FJ224_08075 [Lentisphaerae bacterium]|nr:hypothetical protein [Lentisphaerota bacterium]